MKIIGVAAQAANGKDTLANYLAEKLNQRQNGDCVKLWNRIGFADAVKKVFMGTFGVSWDFIEEWKRKSDPPPGFDLSVRQCLQLIGDGFRKMKSSIWIEVGFRTDKNIIVSDVRYHNEARAIRDKGGLNVLIWRKGFENDDPNPSESQIKPTVDWFVKSGLEGDVRLLREGSSSQFVTSLEKAELILEPVKLFDFFIRNEGSLEELYSKVDKMLVPAIEGYYVRRTNKKGD